MTSWYESYAAQQDNEPTKRSVLVIHGWNDHVRNSILDLLNALGLRPLEWDQALKILGHDSSQPGAVVDYAFENLQAIVILVSPGEFVETENKDHYEDGNNQSQDKSYHRPNVLFEAGMALAKDTRRTVLVEIGTHHTLTYLGNEHILRLPQLAKEAKDAH